jgi:hypothetical protein
LECIFVYWSFVGGRLAKVQADTSRYLYYTKEETRFQESGDNRDDRDKKSDTIEFKVPNNFSAVVFDHLAAQAGASNGKIIAKVQL